MTMDHGVCKLAIDPPRVAGAPRLATPCRILDDKLQLREWVLADGGFHEVPAGRSAVLIELPGGFARRRVIHTLPDREYRLRFHPIPALRLAPDSLAFADDG